MLLWGMDIAFITWRDPDGVVPDSLRGHDQRSGEQKKKTPPFHHAKLFKSVTREVIPRAEPLREPVEPGWKEWVIPA